MTKQTKMLLGVGVLAAAGYLLYKQSKKPKAFANMAAQGRNGPCKCSDDALPDARGMYNCCDGISMSKIVLNKGTACKDCNKVSA